MRNATQRIHIYSAHENEHKFEMLLFMPFTNSCKRFHFVLLQVIGPKLMENRKPFNLRYTLIVYNFTQVIFSAWLFYEVSAILLYHLPFSASSIPLFFVLFFI